MNSLNKLLLLLLRIIIYSTFLTSGILIAQSSLLTKKDFPSKIANSKLNLMQSLNQTSWQWLNPMPQGNQLNDIYSIDEQSLIAVGDNGTVVKSTNGGGSWKVINIYGAKNLTKILFFDSTHGYVTDDQNSYYFTEDAGDTWNKRFDNFIHSRDLFSFIDNNTCVNLVSMSSVLNDTRILRVTTNGGKTWNDYDIEFRANLGVKLIDLNKNLSINTNLICHFFDPLRIINYDSSFIYITMRSNDLEFPLYPGYHVSSNDLYLYFKINVKSPQRIVFANPSTLYDAKFNVDSQGRYIYGSGRSYSYLSMLVEDRIGSNNRNMLFYNSDGKGFISSDEGKTGYTITLPSANLKFNKQGLFCYDGTNIYRTTDLGKTFSSNTKIYSVIPINSFCPSNSPSSSSVWFCGVAGYTSKINNWSGVGNLVSKGFYENILGMHFYSNREGIFITSSGTIYQSSDGGSSWSMTDDLQKAVFDFKVSDDQIFIATDSGILKISDLGKTKLFITDRACTKITISNGGQFISYVNLGENKLYWSFDSGTNWNSKTLSGPNVMGYFLPRTLITGLDVIYNPNSLAGSRYNLYILLQYGYSKIVDYSPYFSIPSIVTSTDEGKSWNEYQVIGSTGTNPTINCELKFFNEKIGLINDGSKSYSTLDGGKSWKSISNADLNGYKQFNIIDKQTGFASGKRAIKYFGGQVLTTSGSGVQKTTDGGLTWTTLFKGEFNGVSVKKGSDYEMQFIYGDYGKLLVSAVSPLKTHYWTWSGNVDSSWTNPDNWNPPGLPVPSDSVVIPTSQRSPLIDKTQQQIVIAGLNIQPGAKLSITDSLKRFVVLGDLKIGGTLELVNLASTGIIVGGNWSIKPGTYLKKSFGGNSIIDKGFIPGKSNVTFRGSGNFENKFYNLTVDSSAILSSSGNVYVQNQMINLNSVKLRDTDTLFINNQNNLGLIGNGRTIGGTIKRWIEKNNQEIYQFGNSNRSLRFSGQGTYPISISIKEKIGINTNNLISWSEVVSQSDTVNHRVIAKSINKFSRWIIKKPGGGKSSILSRMFEISTESGSGFSAELSLDYNEEDIPAGVDKSNLVLARVLEEVTEIKNMQNEIPTKYMLYQNYPNPFNPRTKIGYSIPKQGRVKIMVYDLLGREVRSLLDEEKTAGRYDMQFDSNGLANGVYFYKLEANDFLEVKKMILLK